MRQCYTALNTVTGTQHSCNKLGIIIVVVIITIRPLFGFSNF